MDSVALHRLNQLNSIYRPLTINSPPIEMQFLETVSSKSTFDTFDLWVFMKRRLADAQQWFQWEVDQRAGTISRYAEYEAEFGRFGRETLGTTTNGSAVSKHFERREERMFNSRKLRKPEPHARIHATVAYRSSRGQNVYSRAIEMNWEQLLAALAATQSEREQQSNSQFLRQRERALMTGRLRMQVLRRDDFRCKMCGASGRDGVELHVDHVVPVSYGGRTMPENLQALCKACNLGKSNTFIG